MFLAIFAANPIQSVEWQLILPVIMLLTTVTHLWSLRLMKTQRRGLGVLNSVVDSDSKGGGAAGEGRLGLGRRRIRR